MSRGFKAERIASKLGAQADPRSSLHKEFDKIKGWLPEVFPMAPGTFLWKAWPRWPTTIGKYTPSPQGYCLTKLMLPISHFVEDLACDGLIGSFHLVKTLMFFPLYRHRR